MRQRFDLALIYRRARDRFRRYQIDGQPPMPLPETCPVTLDELMTKAVTEFCGGRCARCPDSHRPAFQLSGREVRVNPRPSDDQLLRHLVRAREK